MSKDRKTTTGPRNKKSDNNTLRAFHIPGIDGPRGSIYIDDSRVVYVYPSADGGTTIHYPTINFRVREPINIVKDYLIQPYREPNSKQKREPREKTYRADDRDEQESY